MSATPLRIEGSPQARRDPAVWLSGKEAAAHVGVSWPTLRRTIVDSGIPYLRLGRCWKIELAALDRHLRKMAQSR